MRKTNKKFEELKQKAKQKNYIRTTEKKIRFFESKGQQDNKTVHEQQMLRRKERDEQN